MKMTMVELPDFEDLTSGADWWMVLDWKWMLSSTVQMPTCWKHEESRNW